jgi:hypothetical protein
VVLDAYEGFVIYDVFVIMVMEYEAVFIAFPFEFIKQGAFIGGTSSLRAQLQEGTLL